MILRTNLLFIILSFMYLSANGQEQIKGKKLIGHNDRLYYKKEPLNGYYRIIHSSWTKEVSNFIDGKREGSASRFQSGSLVQTTKYKNGKKEGEEITYYYYYYNSGGDEVSKVSNYKNDLLNGWQLTYFTSTQLESKTLYENGEIKQSIYYFQDGNIQKECSFNSGEKVCVRFQTENSKNSNYKIIDSLFYKDERIINQKTFVNGILDSEIKVKYEKDSTGRFSDEVLIISFYKLKTFKKAYILYTFSSGDKLVDLIISSYKSIYQPHTHEITNTYLEPCEIATLNEYWMVNHFYVKNEKSLYEVYYIINLDDMTPNCNLDLI